MLAPPPEDKYKKERRASVQETGRLSTPQSSRPTSRTHSRAPSISNPNFSSPATTHQPCATGHASDQGAASLLNTDFLTDIFSPASASRSPSPRSADLNDPISGSGSGSGSANFKSAPADPFSPASANSVASGEVPFDPFVTVVTPAPTQATHHPPAPFVGHITTSSAHSYHPHHHRTHSQPFHGGVSNTNPFDDGTYDPFADVSAHYVTNPVKDGANGINSVAMGLGALSLAPSTTNSTAPSPAPSPRAASAASASVLPSRRASLADDAIADNFLSFFDPTARAAIVASTHPATDTPTPPSSQPSSRVASRRSSLDMSHQPPPIKEETEKELASESKAPLPSSSSSSASAVSPPRTVVQPLSTVRVINVDVMAYMRKGTSLLKYGTYGYPHFRLFQLSSNATHVQWFSQAKSLKDSKVAIASMVDLRSGQTTPAFQRHKAPELAKCSFSLFYDHGRRSLDLIAKDINEYTIWTQGIRKLMDLSQEPHALLNLKQLVMPVRIDCARRSAQDIINHDTGLSAADLLLSTAEGKQAMQRRGSFTSANKTNFKVVAERFQVFRVRLDKHSMKLRESRYRQSPSYPQMAGILLRCQEAEQKAQEHIRNGEYSLADEEVWRADVDLESLKNMMRVVA